MKRRRMLAILVLALGLMVLPTQAAPVGTAFSYQGRLIDANDTADGEYDFQFKLYNSPADGNQLGSTIDVNELELIDGYFTVELDFNDPNAFSGDARWLEIGVRDYDPCDVNAFTTLSPRQEVTPTPYALYALSGNEGPTYAGLPPVDVNNLSYTIGLNPATNPGDLMTWDGYNWIAKKPAVLQFDRDNMQPYLGVNFVIALMGVYPSRNAAEPFIAEIMMFAGNFAPRGWAFCDGQLLAIAQNTALFSLLGTTYGGDGRTTFALPDLRGRVPLHPGTGPGLTNRRLGDRGGSETVQDTRLEN